MEKASGVLIMTMLEISQYLGLKIVHHLILTILENDFLILGEWDIFGINGSFGASEKYWY